MPFRIALSGLNASATDLRVIGHNIANASTVGFKKSRTEFADIFPASSLGTSQNSIGSGVKVAAVNQQFSQGNINFTNNNLDLAISGQGMFIVSDNGANIYTRAGNFGVDNQGYVVNNQSQRLQAYQADINGNITGALGDLRLDTSNIAPRATDNLQVALNLDASAPIPGSPLQTTSFAIPNTTVLDPDAPAGTTYNSPAFTAYDTYGNPISVNVRYVKTATPNQFDMFLVQGASTFPASGNPIDVTAMPGSTNFNWDPDGIGAQPAFTVTADLSQITIAAADAVDNTVATAPTGVNGTTQPAFSATDATTYNNSTSVTVYDSLGTSHLMTTYYRKTSTPNAWEMYTTVDGTAVGGANPITFSNLGNIVSPASPASFTLPPYLPTGGAAPMNITVDVGSLTQYGSPFSVNSLVQNGYTTGRLNGIDIGETGIVSARYTNGQTRTLAQVALANFTNNQGLRQLGDTSWAETFDSGAPLIAAPGSGAIGLIQSGAEEGSNVDLTEQLVNMITAQRNFQANAQVITTADTITQTIINIR